MNINSNLLRKKHALVLMLALTPALLAGCLPSEELQMVGTLERDRIDLHADSDEPITDIYLEDGVRVEAGTPILRQEATRLQARRDQAQANRDLAAARLDELRRGPRTEAIAEARARLTAARAREVNARQEHQRLLRLFEQRLASEAVQDQAYAAWQSAIGDTQALAENLAALEAGTTEEVLRQAEASLAAAEASLRQASIDLDRSLVVAPGTGTLDRILFQVGERPARGATIAVLLDDTRSFARIYVPESWRTRVQPGSRWRVEIDGNTRTHVGTVRWVSSDAAFTPYFALTEYDRSRLSYLAEIDLPDAADLPAGIPLLVSPLPPD